MKHFKIFLVFGIFLAFYSISQADIPNLINFQGILDSAGNPLANKTKSVEFSIYDALAGGNLKWSETQSVTTNAGGVFNVVLGTSNPIPDSVFKDTLRWLNIKVGAEDLIPRQQIVSSAYGYRVATVDGATGGTIFGNTSIQSDLNVSGKATIGPGHTNTGAYAFVAGANSIASGNWSTVGGGLSDTASGFYSTVSGGDANVASGPGSAVGGGIRNIASEIYATVGGGVVNTASGQISTVPGGYLNAARGDGSLAAGFDAKANHDGAIVIAANNYAGDDMDSVGSSGVEQMVFRADGHFYLTDIGGAASIPAGRFLNTSTGGYLSTTGTWTNASSKAYKTDIQIFQNSEYSELLKKLEQIDVVRFRYKIDPTREHIGLIAEDVPEEIASDDRTGIPTADAIGFLMAALKAQQTEIESLEQMLKQLQGEQSEK